MSKTEIRTALAEKFKIADENTIFVFGFRIAFGGQKSTGFATVYKTVEDAYATEPKFRLVRAQLIAPENRVSRKVRKDIKNKRKRLPGLQKDRGKRKRAGADDD